jgi:putative FmdB family regulatory protein
MPLYEYECEACGHRFETIQKFSDPPLERCPKCGGVVRKLQSAPAFHLKGSGWYITDYARKDSGAAGAESKSDTKAGETATDTKTESKRESKSESKRESKRESKSESKRESKSESKGESKSESKGESKPQSAPPASDTKRK